MAGNPGYSKVNVTHDLKAQLFLCVTGICLRQTLETFSVIYAFIFIYKVTLKDYFSNVI